MHWFHIEKTTHNENAIREYERGESKMIAGWLKWLAPAVPLILLIIWLKYR